MRATCRLGSLTASPLAFIARLAVLAGVLGIALPALAADVEIFDAVEVYTGDIEAFLDFALSSDDIEQVRAESEYLSPAERDLVCLVAPRESMPLDELNQRFVAIGWPGPYFNDDRVEGGEKRSGAMPQYSEEARIQRIEGRVSASIALDADGRPRSLYLDGDPLLTASAARTLVDWRFEPARIDGDPVAVCRNFASNFKLQ